MFNKAARAFVPTKSLFLRINMKKFIRSRWLAVAVLFCFMTEVKAQSTIAFDVSFSEPQAHYADVVMKLSGLNKDFVDIKMPVWAPGSYLVREFAKNVEALSARNSGGTSLPVEKMDKNTWRIRTGKNTQAFVSYKVYANEISVRTSLIDASHAFLSPTGMFMYVDGRKEMPCLVTVFPHKSWSRISTGLEPVKGKPNTFRAADFDILFDSPIEVGNQDVFEFTAAGVKHEVAMYGGGNYDKQQLSADMARIVEEETAIFGENPNKRYVFIVHNFQSGGGGLEHINSTVLGASRFAYKDPAGRTSFLSLVAHEYFHLWNVKRLRPAGLGPFDYDKEVYTTDLWISEGLTAYYDNLITHRAGFFTPEQYLKVLADDITALENQPGNRVQALSESSFDAWIKQYRPNENSKNSSISYYTKGSLMGMLLDLEILKATGGAKKLDDVMSAMYKEYYKRLNRGFTSAEFKAMLEKVAGRSFDAFYRDYIYSTAPVDYSKYLNYAGLKLVNELEGRDLPATGLSMVQRDGKLMVTSVLRGSAAWDSGLTMNDEVLAVDGFRVSSAAEMDRFVNAKNVRDKINVTIARDGLLQVIPLTLKKNMLLRFRIAETDTVTEEQRALRAKWLKL